jgi:hypothetical protein
LKAAGQIVLLRHTEHLGYGDLHVVCPNPTSKWFTSCQSSRGSQSSSSFLVPSGSLLRTQPILLEMRCTWVSTPITTTNQDVTNLISYPKTQIGAPVAIKKMYRSSAAIMLNPISVLPRQNLSLLLYYTVVTRGLAVEAPIC